MRKQLNKEEKEFVEDVRGYLMYLAVNQKQHPTYLLIKIIEETYGHKIDMGKLIELIESSPLK